MSPERMAATAVRETDVAETDGRDGCPLGCLFPPPTPGFFFSFFLTIFFFTEFLFDVVRFCLGRRRVPSSSPSV